MVVAMRLLPGAGPSAVPVPGHRDGRSAQQQSVQYSGADVVSLMEPVLRIVIFFMSFTSLAPGGRWRPAAPKLPAGGGARHGG
ncbi:hypothetical protein L083_3503 [Actinoplanes sp. N902-109]|nr:hypothetical protein L083_3503 [Actinoplanes sp. N902-109]